jgi:hypothetical protein
MLATAAATATSAAAAATAAATDRHTCCSFHNSSNAGNSCAQYISCRSNEFFCGTNTNTCHISNGSSADLGDISNSAYSSLRNIPNSTYTSGCYIFSRTNNFLGSICKIYHFIFYI